MLVDKQIVPLLNNVSDDKTKTWIEKAETSCVTNIGYDLRSAKFAKNGKQVNECHLLPGESVFVATQEIVNFGTNMSGRIVLKNSRIRQGFSLEAPQYQPGHKTVIYFRLTNISDNELILSAGESYTTLIFEKLSDVPDYPYSGTFQKEFDFKNLANYESVYKEQIQSLEGKVHDLKSLERSIYGNVITILSIFVAIFTILNVNIGLAQKETDAMTFLVFNLATLGSISFLASLLSTFMSDKKRFRWLWLAPIICFIAIALVIFI